MMIMLTMTMTIVKMIVMTPMMVTMIMTMARMSLVAVGLHRRVSRRRHPLLFPKHKLIHYAMFIALAGRWPARARYIA